LDKHPIADLDYDAIVVGARVAGSTFAALLGDAGHRVLLVDRATFPSPTLSTHYFRGGRAVSVLKRLGVLDEVLDLGCPPLTAEYRFRNGATEPVVGPAQQPGDVTFCLSVRRAPLDHILVRRATRSASVHVLEATALKDVLRDGGRVVGARLTTPDGEIVARSRCVIGADGRQSLVARLAQAPIQESERAHRGIYYCYVRGFAAPAGSTPDGPEFHFSGDEVAYVFPSDGGVTCIALSLNLPTFSWLHERPAERFRERIACYPGLAERFAASPQLGRLLGCGPFPNTVRVPAGPGWALVGDAGMHQDPWSGTGIDKAMVHATLLAEALGCWLSGEVCEREAGESYHRARDADGLQSYRDTTSLSRDLRQLLVA
jgi:menaquinone-9 beta-reductase